MSAAAGDETRNLEPAGYAVALRVSGTTGEPGIELERILTNGDCGDTLNVETEDAADGHDATNVSESGEPADATRTRGVNNSAPGESD